MAWTLRRIWDSPTMMTWASLGTNALRFFLVLPLVLRLFTAEDVAVWYLMATLLQVQFMLDLGFSATGSRFFAYAMGGATDLERPGEGTGTPNHALLGRIYTSLRSVFLLLGLAAGAVLGVVGTVLLFRPISASTSPTDAWTAWGIMLVGTTIGFCGLVYSTYLQGTNRVALARRWETLTNVGAIATIVAVLSWRADLVAFAVATQAWTIVALVRNRALAKRTEPTAFQGTTGWRPDPSTMRSIWTRAWRSGLGVLLNAGVVRMSAGLLAFFVTPAALAAYLVAFNVLDRLNQFASAPFYSQLPRLATLYAKKSTSELLASAKTGIGLTLGLFVATAGLLGLLAKPALAWLGSDTPFIGIGLWSALAGSLAIHRFGAMQLQLYTLSNHVVWHIVDGLAGLMYLGVLAALVATAGLWAVPIAMLVAYGGFYTPVATRSWARLRRTLVT